MLSALSVADISPEIGRRELIETSMCIWPAALMVCAAEDDEMQAAWKNVRVRDGREWRPQHAPNARENYHHFIGVAIPITCPSRRGP
jgi:hypothetical protein